MLPFLVTADERGRIFDHPSWLMAGRSGSADLAPDESELIPLPEGSALFSLPGRRPVGIDPRTGRPGEPPGAAALAAVSAFLPAGYLRLLLPAARPLDGAPLLPLYAYSAVGWRDGRFWVPAFRVDPDTRCDPGHYQDDEGLAGRVRLRLAREPRNRLLAQLARCALEYHCFAAKNTFNRRWELPLPSAPTCPARCVGCISLQPSGCCPASQERIRFVPSPTEIVEIALPHLRNATRPIASFGQGCEGEPLTVSPTLAEAVRRLRKLTARGTINLNTNGFSPSRLENVLDAGLDSVRISLASADPALYDAYHRGGSFGLAEVKAAMAAVKRAGRYLALNLLVFPGVTDRPAEIEALVELHDEAPFDLIQMRNMNIDPGVYLEAMGGPDRWPGPGLGLMEFMRGLRRRLPSLQFGYFNPIKEEFAAPPRSLEQAPPESGPDASAPPSGPRPLPAPGPGPAPAARAPRPARPPSCSRPPARGRRRRRSGPRG